MSVVTRPAVARRSPSLVVAIVNWRTAELTINCLRSIAAQINELPECRVIVVDNGSGDGSAERIQGAIEAERWRFATVLRLVDNRGFAAGNNAAVRAALKAAAPPEYVVLLNPDTLVRPHAFQILVEFMESHPTVGIAGGRSEDPDETPQVCCFRFPNPVSEFALYLRIGAFARLVEPFLTQVPIPEQPREIDWVSGAFMIVRRSVFETIGLLDEAYFLYFEETDFTLRARRAGWTCWHVPQSRIVHLVGQSSGVTRRGEAPKRLPSYWFESRTRYFALNHGAAYSAVTDLLVVAACAVSAVRRLVQPALRRDPPRFIRDLLQFSALRRKRPLAARQIDL
jgi:N-acetylglucosaminyl-diphospho-decaprenol L-rhamnosyltransferase